MLRQITFLWHAMRSLVSPKSQSGHNIPISFSIGSVKRYPLLIIPGFGQSVEGWKKVARLLSISFGVTILELPNRGRRIFETKGWTELDFARYVEKFIKANFDKKLILLGHSLGGKTAAIVSIEMKNQITQLFIYGAGGVRAEIPFMAKIATLLKTLFTPVQTTDFENIYKRVPVKTSLIYGEDDLITPKEIGEKIGKLIPKSTLTIIPKTTHLAHEEKPEIFSQVIYKELK